MHFHTFHEMTSVLAENAPHALVLDWWRRMEGALAYFTIAHYGQRFDTSYEALSWLESDTRLGPHIVQALHGLRRIRNAVAHGPRIHIAPEDATLYATLALHLIGIIGNAVPNDLAISSGAARGVKGVRNRFFLTRSFFAREWFLTPSPVMSPARCDVP